MTTSSSKPARVCCVCNKKTVRKCAEDAFVVCANRACQVQLQHNLNESKWNAPTQQHLVRSVMNGAMVWEPVDLPYSCSVASEAYWCA